MKYVDGYKRIKQYAIGTAMEEQLTQIFKKLKHNNTETKDASYYIGRISVKSYWVNHHKKKHKKNRK